MGGACSEEQPKFQMKADHAESQLSNMKNYPKDVPSQLYATLSYTPVLYDAVTETVKNLKMLKPIKQPSQKGILFPTHLIRQKNLYYHGEWTNGKPNGKGKIYFPHGVYFEGGFKNGHAQCTDGLLVYPDGSSYRGQFHNSKIQGYGVFLYLKNGLQYKGYWVNDKPEGAGEQSYSDGSKYQGKFKNGLKDGQGKFLWADGKRYEGYFKQGYMEGKGKLQKGKGYFDGIFQRSLKKSGKLVTEFGEYEGEFKDGQMDCDNGKFVWNDKKVYIGQFKNGKLHGKGVLTYPNGQKAQGIWQNGENIQLDKVKK